MITLKIVKIFNTPCPGKGTETRFNATLRDSDENKILSSANGIYSFCSKKGVKSAIKFAKLSALEILLGSPDAAEKALKIGSKPIRLFGLENNSIMHLKAASIIDVEFEINQIL